jgi:alkyl hydroperoxide reductase subunit AhpF
LRHFAPVAMMTLRAFSTAPEAVSIWGQKLAGALKAHVSDYNVDVIDSQSATKLTPAATEGGTEM